MATSALLNELFIKVCASVPVSEINKKNKICINVGEVQTGNARNNVAGTRPTPAYKDIVYTESVIVNLFIMMRQTDQSKDDRITIRDPISIVISGLRTISVPINPIIKAVILRILIISLRNKTEKIVVKIGTVKPRAVVSAKLILLKP